MSHGPLHRAVYTWPCTSPNTGDPRERAGGSPFKVQGTVFLQPNLKVLHHFFWILFARSMSLVTQKEGIIQGQEYQQMDITGDHLRGALDSMNGTNSLPPSAPQKNTHKHTLTLFLSSWSLISSLHNSSYNLFCLTFGVPYQEDV